MASMAENVYWTAVKAPVFGGRPIYLAWTERGLCRVTWPHESLEELKTWVNKRLPGAVPEQVREDGSTFGYARQFEEYFAGKRQSFHFSCEFYGTSFQKSVWQSLTRIPYGETRSYSEIAREIGNPSAVRAVGAAIGANPVSIAVPCHRVIGKNAALTGFRGGLQAKEALLRLEGFQDDQAKGHARFQF